jgi:hypothetical protein
MNVTIYHIVNLDVEEIYTLNVWKDGLSTKFQISKKFLALFAEKIGVKIPWKNLKLKQKFIKKYKNKNKLRNKRKDLLKIKMVNNNFQLFK